MEVMANRLDRGFEHYQNEYEDKALEVLRSGWYTLGKELEAFESEYASYIGVKHCIGVASGLDALRISVRLAGIGPGDEVLVPANTYIATIMGITDAGAVPVFVEPDDYYNIDPEQIRKHITEQTKAIMVVHLYGQPARMDQIAEIAKEHKLQILEDCAQAQGATFQNRSVGTFGIAGCYSFYPTKNLGAFGDAGAIVTDSDELAAHARAYRNYGSAKKYVFDEVGVNSRMDEIQAGLLRVKLKHLNELNQLRREIAQRYSNEITSKWVLKPQIMEHTVPVWHQYVVRIDQGKRDQMRQFLLEKGIHTDIHYPIPPHLSKAYQYLGYQKGDLPITEQYANSYMSLPIYDGLSTDEQSYVIAMINAFTGTVC